MPAISLPVFGNFRLCAILVCASYAFAVSIAASPFGNRPGRPHLLPAARLGVYATWAIVAVAVLVLAYAFQAHDFRIRYVSRYSDRSMPWWYLLTSLWGGQDGSLLWWTFLYCTYSAVAAFSLRKRLPELAPMILATLMSVVMFYGVLMLFAANPLGEFIDRNPTIKMLALAFIVLVGVVLIADGFGVHVPRGYVYVGMGFSALVELLNLWAKRHAMRHRETERRTKGR